MTSLLYIIPYRCADQFRAKNLNIVLQWAKSVKTMFFSLNQKIVFDILVIEQSEKQSIKNLVDINHIFIYNKGAFNKAWAFNVAVKQNPDYDYYIFADADIIILDVKGLCSQIIAFCVTTPQPAFRLFNDCLATDMLTLSDCQDFNDLMAKQPLKLVRRGSITFAGGNIAISRQTYDKIGGWDEQFEGWGREDNFMTIKLQSIGECKKIICNLPSIHLWHPVLVKLNKTTIDLYAQLSTYTNDQLLELIVRTKLLIGNPQKYSMPVQLVQPIQPIQSNLFNQSNQSNPSNQSLKIIRNYRKKKDGRC